MKRERPLLGLAAAVLCVLPTAPLALLLFRADGFVGLAGAVGFLLALGGWRLGAGQVSDLGCAVCALLPLPAALPGLYYGCAELIFRQNEVYGCTLEEALELVPTVALDPYNRGQLWLAVGGVLLLSLLTALLSARYFHLRRTERQNNKQERL